MFDRRFINGKYRIYSDMLRTNDPDLLKQAKLFAAINDIMLELPNVRLFDYVFAVEFFFVYPNDFTMTGMSFDGVSRQTMEELNKKLSTAGSFGKSLSRTNGLIFSKRISNMDIFKIYLMFLIPPEPYDMCTMSLDDYYQLYQFAHYAEIDDAYFNLEEWCDVFCCQIGENDIRAGGSFTTPDYDIVWHNTMGGCCGMYNKNVANEPITDMESLFAIGPHDFTGPTWLSDIFNVLMVVGMFD